MKIRGTISKVIDHGTINGNNSQFDKATAILVFPSDDGTRMENLVVTVLRFPEDREKPSWKNPIFSFVEGNPLPVEIELQFRSREYNGKYYQDVQATNCEYL